MDLTSNLHEEGASHNFTVAARIKPHDIEDENFKIVLNKNHQEMYIETRNGLKSFYNGQKSKNFKLNHIFPESTTNESIFNDLVKEKLELLKKNCSVSVMAYGATNSGKTFTIFGQKN